MALLVAGPTAAFAAPTNDDFSAAVAIDSLPFSTTLDTTDATWDPSDPSDCHSNASVWYSFTPTSDMRIKANTFGSNYDTTIGVWTGSQGSLSLVACNDDYNGLQSQISFTATAGTTYYFLLGRCCGGGSNGGGSLVFSVEQIQAAANDNFANAISISTLPYSNTQDYSTAGAEAGEPSSCFNPVNTVWYSYTATATRSITASTTSYYSGIAAYTGTSLDNLSQVGCRGNYNSQPLTFVAEEGTTYFFQVEANGTTGEITFELNVAPNPDAQFDYYPSEPSSYDTISFYSSSYDPAGGEISFAWDFGDGTTSTSQYPSHRYAADGDYTVQLTVRTPDGRSDSISHTLQVRTHDISIDRLNLPATAKVGQTIGVHVYLKNTRYPETVRVTLYKSVPSGFIEVGSSTQLVKVSTTGQTTRYSFNYTVTSDDLATGKITFKATAWLTEHTDALPADNELLSSPVKVSS